MHLTFDPERAFTQRYTLNLRASARYVEPLQGCDQAIGDCLIGIGIDDNDRASVGIDLSRRNARTKICGRIKLWHLSTGMSGQIDARAGNKLSVTRLCDQSAIFDHAGAAR